MVHRIDGEVAFVGVMDLTPSCLSSVYLYYDPKYEFLSPGTLTAIREIEYIKKVREAGLAPDTFQYYYMGFYFQDCVKSVYKAHFRPSQVACPQTYTYVPLTEQVKKLIDSEKMPRLVPKDAPDAFPRPTIEVAKEGG